MSNPDNAVTRRADPAEVTSRVQGLVQSPLRAAILRFMCARPDESFIRKKHRRTRIERRYWVSAYSALRPSVLDGRFGSCIHSQTRGHGGPLSGDTRKPPNRIGWAASCV